LHGDLQVTRLARKSRRAELVVGVDGLDGKVALVDGDVGNGLGTPHLIAAAERIPQTELKLAGCADRCGILDQPALKRKPWAEGGLSHHWRLRFWLLGQSQATSNGQQSRREHKTNKNSSRLHFLFLLFTASVDTVRFPAPTGSGR